MRCPACGHQYDHGRCVGKVVNGVSPARCECALDHWLVFNDKREIVGCRCGFAADTDSDCGWGDSVVRHLLAEGWDARAKAKPQYLGPDGGHYPDHCYGYGDCHCASYPNPYESE